MKPFDDADDLIEVREILRRREILSVRRAVTANPCVRERRLA